MQLPSPSSKLSWLISMLPTLAPLGKIIIFVASRVECERILQSIRRQCSQSHPKLKAESIHGDKHQHDRNAALRQFEKGQIEALVATDVASRGLDVKDVMTVINFDVAKNLDIHTHRIGRAGRMSASANTDSNEEQKYQKGIAYTLMTRKDSDFANLLMENFIKEGREIENELKDLARYSKFYGRYAGGGIQKKQVHGIGWNRDEFQKPGDSDINVSSNDASRNNANKRSKTFEDNSSHGYYGPSSNAPIQDMGKERFQPKKVGKRKRWG